MNSGLLKKLSGFVLSSPVAAMPVETVAPAETPPTIAADAGADHDIELVLALIEADLKRAHQRLGAVGDDMKRAAGESVALIQGIREQSDHLDVQTGEAKAKVAHLTEAVRRVVDSSTAIGERVRVSGQLVDEADGAAGAATRSIEELRAAIGEIQTVVTLISTIAGQTNLLALNATIEAARAGAAGRGFAVVASEVKALSVETQKATAEIENRIARLRGAAEHSIASVDRVIRIIGDIRPATDTMTAAVSDQIGAIGEVGGTVAETTRFAEDVAGRAAAIRAATEAAAMMGATVDGASARLNTSVVDMTRQLLTVLRQTPQGDRRRSDRWPTEMHVTINARGRRLQGRTVDLSNGGVLIRPEGGDLSQGESIVLGFSGKGEAEASVVGVSPLGCHVAFRHPVPAFVADLITAVAADYKAPIERVTRGAAAMAAAMEAALQSRLITHADLFDTTYVAIPGTDPQQYRNRALDVLDRILPPIQEPMLGEDKRMTFAAAVDINGYLPVHNKVYSQPQRPGDPIWNAANARNRRIFDDRAGLLAARNTRPFLVQNYRRDLGGGNFVVMREVDAPIVVGGRHWGGLRNAYRF